MLQAYVGAKLSPWLLQTLRETIVKLDRYARSHSPFREDNSHDQDKLLGVLRNCCLKVQNGLKVLPSSARQLFYDLFASVMLEVPGEIGTLDNMVRSAIFLRCVCLAIRGPEMFGILPAKPEPATESWLKELSNAFKDVVFSTGLKKGSHWDMKRKESTGHQAKTLDAEMQRLFRPADAGSRTSSDHPADSPQSAAQGAPHGTPPTGRLRGISNPRPDNVIMEAAVGTSLPSFVALAAQELTTHITVLEEAGERLEQGTQREPTEERMKLSRDFQALLSHLRPLQVLIECQLNEEKQQEQGGASSSVIPGVASGAVVGAAADDSGSQNGTAATGVVAPNPTFYAMTMPPTDRGPWTGSPLNPATPQHPVRPEATEASEGGEPKLNAAVRVLGTRWSSSDTAVTSSRDSNSSLFVPLVRRATGGTTSTPGYVLKVGWEWMHVWNARDREGSRCAALVLRRRRLTSPDSLGLSISPHCIP